jgi:hypothetical protein
MRSDLTRQPLYRTLVDMGAPQEVAVRAAFLAGPRDPRFIDYRLTKVNDAASDTRRPEDVVAVHAVVVLTEHAVIEVSAGEHGPEWTETSGQEMTFYTHGVWSRDRLAMVTLGGPEESWHAVLEASKAREPRTYTLSFGADRPTVTIPLTIDRQDEADEVAACLVMQVS